MTPTRYVNQTNFDLARCSAGEKATQTMSSREIADLTGSTHDNVLKTVRSLIKRGVVSGNETPYVHPQNGQTYSEVLLDYRNTMVVVSGYSVELRAKIIDKWQELEQRVSAFDPMAALNDPAAMRGILLSYTEKVLELEAVNAELSPKAEALDRIATADGSLCITDAAKALQMRRKDLFSYLQEHGWIYRRPNNSAYLGYQSKTASGLVEHKVTTVLRADGSEKITEQVRITPKGLAKLAVLIKPLKMAA